METQPYFQPGRLYTAQETREGLNLSRTHIHRMEKGDNFPDPVTFGSAKRWRGEDLLLLVAHGDAWKEHKKAAESAPCS